MKSKRGTGADRAVFMIFWFFVLFIFVLMTQCIKPVISGKEEVAIKVSFDEQSDTVLLLGLLNYEVDNKLVREVLSYEALNSQTGVDRSTEINEVLLKALRETSGLEKFKLYLGKSVLTKKCLNRCYPSKREYSFEFVLPQRDGKALEYRLELYRK
tara:strand:- start:2479 stop:2946 length:468 start_codon:yes stop_codon:yes gene_type:complete